MADPRIPDWVFPDHGEGLTLLPGGRADVVVDDSAASAWNRRVAAARRVLAVGEGPGALAQLVVRPGLDLLGRRYRPDGSNRLGDYIRTADELRQVAMHEPLTVAPSHAYVIVDVDYAAADDAVACEQMARRVDAFCDRTYSTGIDVVRVRSGGYCDRDVKVGPDGPLDEAAVQAGPFGRLEVVPDDQLVDTPPVLYGEVVDVRVGDDGYGVQTRRYHHEHLWIVTGWHTMAAQVRTWVARRLRTVLPGCQIVGGARVGGLDGQQVRPPGTRHRTSGWPDAFDYSALFRRLATINPPRGCFESFAIALASMHHEVITTRRARIRLQTTPRQQGLAGWAVDYLDNGIPDTPDRTRWYPDGAPPAGTDLTRSGQFARLVGHLLVNKWSLADIIDRLVLSAASAHLAERQGHQTLAQRVAADVERIAGQHRTRTRPHAPLVVHQVAAAWPDMTLPDGTTSKGLTHSGRMVMAALCRHAVRTGYLTVLAQRRTLAIEAGVSKSSVDRALHRWVDLGVLTAVRNDVGDLVDVELDSDMLARLLPDRVSGTQSVHAPPDEGDTAARKQIIPELDEVLRRHDAWLARPAGSANLAVPLGRAAQTVAGWLALYGSGTVTEIADGLQVTRGHVCDVLARLRYHLVAWQQDGIWQLQTDPTVLSELLDHAAQVQNTAGLLVERRVRYLDEIATWQTNSTLVGVVQADVDRVIDQLRQHTGSKQPRAPGLTVHSSRAAA